MNFITDDVFFLCTVVKTTDITDCLIVQSKLISPENPTTEQLVATTTTRNHIDNIVSCHDVIQVTPFLCNVLT